MKKVKGRGKILRGLDEIENDEDLIGLDELEDRKELRILNE